MAEKRSRKRNRRTDGRERLRAEQQRDRRQRKRRRQYDEAELSVAERKRLRKRERQRKIRAIKRRLYSLLLLILLGIIAFLYFQNKKGTVTISGNEAVSNDRVKERSRQREEVLPPIEEAEEEAADYPKAYKGAIPVSDAMEPSAPLSVIRGRAAINLASASSNSVRMSRAEKISSSKAAMEQAAFFTGTSKTVNEYFMDYGEGRWHGIIGVDDELYIFYEGSHVETVSVVSENGATVLKELPEQTFRVTFILYEDGTFVVQGVTQDGKNVDDYEEFLKSLVNKG